MKRAFAIGCWQPSPEIEWETLACIRSIRVAGHKEDIVVLTLDNELANRIGARDWQIRCLPPIHYEAIKLRRFKKLGFCDAQKMYFWKLTNYDRVIALDSDVVVTANCSTLFESSGLWAKRSDWATPLNTGIMIYTPDEKVFDDLFALTQTGNFDRETGWKNCGNFWWDYKKKQHDWHFTGSCTSAGYLLYYFGFVKKELKQTLPIYKYFQHFVGNHHRQEYGQLVQSMIPHL